MVLEVLTPPAEEPVSLEEAKLHLKQEVEEDDDLIEAMIAAAREWAESYLNRALVTQTIRLSLPCFPGGCQVIELPRPRLIEVTELAYVDGDGADQVMTEDRYQVDIRREPGRLAPAYGLSWPATRRVFNAVSVTYQAGYGDADDVPQCVKRAMLVMIGGLYENRQAFETGTIITELKMGQLSAAEALALPERIKRFL